MKDKLVRYASWIELRSVICFVIMLLSIMLLFAEDLTIIPVISSGKSMLPTITEREFALAHTKKEIQQFDIVLAVFKDDKEVVKRVIALPGDTIEIVDSVVYINGVRLLEEYIVPMTHDEQLWPYTLPNDSYFLMGDNRPDSYDSRYVGAIEADRIIGVIIFRVPLFAIAIGVILLAAYFGISFYRLTTNKPNKANQEGVLNKE